MWHLVCQDFSTSVTYINQPQTDYTHINHQEVAASPYINEPHMDFTITQKHPVLTVTFTNEPKINISNTVAANEEPGYDMRTEIAQTLTEESNVNTVCGLQINRLKTI